MKLPEALAMGSPPLWSPNRVRQSFGLSTLNPENHKFLRPFQAFVDGGYVVEFLVDARLELSDVGGQVGHQPASTVV